MRETRSLVLNMVSLRYPLDIKKEMSVSCQKFWKKVQAAGISLRVVRPDEDCLESKLTRNTKVYEKELFGNRLWK